MNVRLAALYAVMITRSATILNVIMQRVNNFNFGHIYIRPEISSVVTSQGSPIHTLLFLSALLAKQREWFMKHGVLYGMKLL